MSEEIKTALEHFHAEANKLELEGAAVEVKVKALWTRWELYVIALATFALGIAAGAYFFHPG
jgi:hypothetical protein